MKKYYDSQTERMTLPLDFFTEDELLSVADLNEDDLIDLNNSFVGIVKNMDMCSGKSEVLGFAHQSHHLGYDFVLMEALASDERTIQRAEFLFSVLDPISFSSYQSTR